VIGGGHFDTAKLSRNAAYALVVGRDDNFRESPGLLAPLDDALDDWFAGDECERFAWKPAGSIPGGDDANHMHGLCLAMRDGDCTDENQERRFLSALLLYQGAQMPSV
jgi:hypothetical protein